jgi:hypothetical protein
LYEFLIACMRMFRPSHPSWFDHLRIMKLLTKFPLIGKNLLETMEYSSTLVEVPSGNWSFSGGFKPSGMKRALCTLASNEERRMWGVHFSLHVTPKLAEISVPPGQRRGTTL